MLALGELDSSLTSFVASGRVWLYAGFLAIVFAFLAVDLGLFNRKARVVGAPRALAFTGATVVMALGFAAFIYWAYQRDWLGIAGPRHGEGEDASIQFITGWLVEYSLSLDNVLVIAIIFQHFRVPREQQHRVLFWGVLGALFFRGVLIGAGALLVQSFSWILYVFGAILLVTAIKLIIGGGSPPDPSRTIAARIARRLFPLSAAYDGEHFFTRTAPEHPGRLAMTPLFLVLCVIETTDIVFAVDSIPAVFAVTTDPFLVFTSNVLAILGLRSLYFALEAVINRFRYLKASLVIVLGFIGLKMLLSAVVHIEPVHSLIVVTFTLTVGVAASIVRNRLEGLEARLSPADLAGTARIALRRARRTFLLLLGATGAACALIAAFAPGIQWTAVVIGGAALVVAEAVWAAVLLKGMRLRAEEFAKRVGAPSGKAEPEHGAAL